MTPKVLRKGLTPLRIGYFIAEAGICGGVAVVCQHANRLARRGFDVCIVSTAGADRIDWFPGLRAPVLPISRLPGGLDVGVATWWETAHDLHRLPIPRKCYFVQSDETRFYGEGRFEPLFVRDTYRYGWEFITEARWIRDWLKREFGREARYVPNGIDPGIFRETAPLAPRGGRPRVLIEGPADMPSKGVADAFRAVERLGLEVWYVNYRGAPDPAWRPDRYFERVPMERMAAVYSSCDILLKMSRVEGAAGPPLEMMACGGTCVVARVTGADEAIEDGVNALVVEPGDVAGAAAAVGRLAADPVLRARLAAAGRETAGRMDWGRSIDVLEEMLLSPPAAAAPADPERERSMIEAYARLKRLEAALAVCTRQRDDRAADAAALRLERDGLWNELNGVRLSKAWRIASALKDARRSPRALLALPYRMFREWR